MQETTTRDIYAAPLAALNEPTPQQPCFYIVAPTKMLIMTIGTFGLYQFYWFYRHWNEWRLAGKGKVLPFLRALFAIFFTFSLARAIDSELGERRSNHPQNEFMAPLVLVLSLVATKIVDSPAFPIDSFALVIAAPLCLLAARSWAGLVMQRAANDASGDVNGDGNARLTMANGVWLLIGALIWVSVLSSMVMVASVR